MSPNVSPVSQVAALCERRVRKRSGGSVRTRAGSGVVERAPAAPTMFYVSGVLRGEGVDGRRGHAVPGAIPRPLRRHH
jgi:hypothetical protein